MRNPAGKGPIPVIIGSIGGAAFGAIIGSIGGAVGAIVGAIVGAFIAGIGVTIYGHIRANIDARGK